MNYIHSSQLNIINQLHTDPIWEHGKIGNLLINKEEDGTFALCTRAKNCRIWAGNCPKCLALGILHNPCRYCHKKESPCYNSIILYQGHIVQPFYFATCMAKPMDLPTKEHELNRFRYDRTDSELEDVVPPTKEISSAEYVIKCPDNDFPPEWLEQAQRVPTQQRNEWFRENLLMPDDNTKYYWYRVVSHTDHTKDHFVLEPCSHQDLLDEIANRI